MSLIERIKDNKASIGLAATAFIALGVVSDRATTANAAEVIAMGPTDGSPCGLLDREGSFATGTTRVNKENIMVCEGQVQKGKGSVRWDYEKTGIECWIGGGLTTYWHQIINSNGQTTAVCPLAADRK